MTAVPAVTGAAGRSGPPKVCLLDVNETLSDMAPLAGRLEKVGLPGQLEVWFASVLRDGFALSMLGRCPVFGEVAAALLHSRLSAAGVTGSEADDAVAYVLGGFAELGVHPDVEPGLRRLHEAGVRLVPLTNGASAMSDRMFDGAGLLPLLERRLSVGDVGPWKPHPTPYAYALDECAVPGGDALMVAVHPWDLQGARSAGLRTAWIRRVSGEWPACFEPPDPVASGVDDLAGQLAGAG